MNQFSKVLFLFLLFSFLLMGCSDNNNGNNQETEKNDTTKETNIEQKKNDEKNDENSNDTMENNSESPDDDSSNEHIEHQRGLKMGETGVVEDNNDKKYEITLNSIKYKDVVGGFEAMEGVHVIADLTVKNISDSSFNAKNIYNPSFGPIDSDMQSTLNPVLLDDESNVDENLLKGEIAPGESVTGVHVFDVEKADKYRLAFGGKGTQIITYAQWEVSDSEFE